MLDNSVLIDSSLNMGSFFYWLNGQDNRSDYPLWFTSILRESHPIKA